MDLPDLPQAQIVQRLTLREATRLAPLSKECRQLSGSRPSPSQACLLHMLSAGVRGGASSFQLMRVLRGLNAMVRQPWRATKCHCFLWELLDMQGRMASVPSGPFSTFAIVKVQTWPAARSYNSRSQCCTASQNAVAGSSAQYSVFDSQDGVHLLCDETAASRAKCRLCAWLMETVLRGWGSGGPYYIRPMEDGKCWRHGDLVWLDIHALDEASFDGVRGLLLAMVQYAASLSAVPKETADQETGSGYWSIRWRAPPVFVFGNISKDSLMAWEDPNTWDPFTDICDVFIVERHRMANQEDCRAMYDGADSLLRFGGQSRARPKILVLT